MLIVASETVKEAESNDRIKPQVGILNSIAARSFIRVHCLLPRRLGLAVPSSAAGGPRSSVRSLLTASDDVFVISKNMD